MSSQKGLSNGTTAAKAKILKESGYDGIKKWGDSAEIQYLNPKKSLTLTNVKQIDNLKKGGVRKYHEGGAEIDINNYDPNYPIEHYQEEHHAGDTGGDTGNTGGMYTEPTDSNSPTYMQNTLFGDTGTGITDRNDILPGVNVGGQAGNIRHYGLLDQVLPDNKAWGNLKTANRRVHKIARNVLNPMGRIFGSPGDPGSLAAKGIEKGKTAWLGLTDQVGGWFKQDGGVRKYQNGGLPFGIEAQGFSNVQVPGVNWAKGIKELEHVSPSRQGVNVSGLNLSRNFKLNNKLNMSLSNPAAVYAKPTIDGMPGKGSFKAFPFEPKIGLTYNFQKGGVRKYPHGGFNTAHVNPIPYNPIESKLDEQFPLRNTPFPQGRIEKGAPWELKKGVRAVESSNGVNMINTSPNSTATGYYGQLYSEIKDMPLMNDISRQEFSTDTILQNKVFDKRWKGDLPNIPGLKSNIKKLRTDYKKETSNFTDNELAALSNFTGRERARQYFASLRAGTEFKMPGEEEGNNKSIPEYMKTYREALKKKKRGGYRAKHIL